MKKGTLLSLLSIGGYISLNKSLVAQFGLQLAVLIGELCSISTLFGGKEFYFAYEKLIKDTGLSEFQIRECLKKLEKMGFVSVEKKGLPCRNYYLLHEDVILDALISEEEDTENLNQSSEIIEDTVVQKVDNCSFNNSSTFNNKNTESKNTESKNRESNIYAHSPRNEDYKNNYSVSNAIQAECFDEIRKCYETLHNIWVKEKLPLSNASQNYFTFSCRELKTALSYWSGKGFTREELVGALNNYLEIVKLIRSGESWMENIGDFNFFAKHILDYVDGNFNLNKYKRSKTIINTPQKEGVDINKILAEMGEV